MNPLDIRWDYFLRGNVPGGFKPPRTPPPQGYGPLWPSVWIRSERNGNRVVTLAFDATATVQAGFVTDEQASEMATIWREDIARGDGRYTCPECVGDWINGRCWKCDGQGHRDQAGLSRPATWMRAHA